MKDQWKHRLNYLITYHRKRLLQETRNNKWKQKEFYHDEKNKLICSLSTASRLENDKAVFDDAIYAFCLQKLRMTLDESNEQYNRVNAILDELYTAIAYYDRSSIIKIAAKLNHLNIAVDDIYYQTLRFIFSKIYVYYQNDSLTLSDDDFHIIYNLMPIFPERLKEILMDFLYLYANNHNECYVKVLKASFSYETSHYLPNQIIWILMLRKQGQNLQSLHLIDTYIPMCIASSNINYTAYLLCLRLSTLQDMDKTLYEKERRIPLQYLKENEIDKFMKANIHQNLISIYMYASDYEEAIECCKEIINSNVKKQLYRTMICMQYCYHRLQRKIPEIYQNRVYQKYADLIDTAFYKYYDQYTRRSLLENLHFLIKEVIPHVKKEDELYILMIDHEMRELCMACKQYKPYMTFRNKFL